MCHCVAHKCINCIPHDQDELREYTHRFHDPSKKVTPPEFNNNIRFFKQTQKSSPLARCEKSFTTQMCGVDRLIAHQMIVGRAYEKIDSKLPIAFSTPIGKENEGKRCFIECCSRGLYRKNPQKHNLRSSCPFFITCSNQCLPVTDPDKGILERLNRYLHLYDNGYDPECKHNWPCEVPFPIRNENERSPYSSPMRNLSPFRKYSPQSEKCSLNMETTDTPEARKLNLKTKITQTILNQLSTSDRDVKIICDYYKRRHLGKMDSCDVDAVIADVLSTLKVSECCC